MVPINHFLILAALLFGIGAFGLMTRRNAIAAFMCIELMLNSVNLTFVSYARAFGTLEGQVGVFFVLVVAAAEAAVGLAIILSLFRSRNSVETSEAASMKH